MLTKIRRQYGKHNLGLFELQPTDVTEWDQIRQEPRLDIVAVHGLNGDCRQSWESKSSTGLKTTWLSDLLPYKLPYVRVLTFGYRAGVIGNTSIAGIRDNARRLLVLLRDKREEDESTHRPIIFVGHSLGGIIIKQALRIARNESSVYGDIADYTKGIVFFGTPHRGADAAKWADSIAAIISSASFRRWFRLPLLRVLKPNSKDLIDISEDFRSIVSNYAIVSFIEDEIFPGLGRVVVGKHSAVMEVSHEEASILGGNHSSICKFDRDDDRFDAVWKAIKRIDKTGKVRPVHGVSTGKELGD